MFLQRDYQIGRGMTSNQKPHPIRYKFFMKTNFHAHNKAKAQNHF